MKPVLEHLPKEGHESFVVRRFEYPYYPTPWHYHPEYELVLVTESTGKRFIGDNVSPFVPGDLVFLGPNLPHTYRNDDRYQQPGSRLKASSIVVHFLESALGADVLALPESAQIRHLLEQSVRGLEILGPTRRAVSLQMHRLLTETGFGRWLLLLEILHRLSRTGEYRPISHKPVYAQNEKERDRMSTVLDYVLQHFAEDIRLKEVAERVNMAENSFSRYFTQRTRKTFIRFLNEVRLNHACTLLAENGMNVAQVCFECGFNNLSNFNRQFKKTYGVHPLGYRRQLLEKGK
ncbi:MAG TPA: AraC family transcriptional regulator [Chitinophagaceae bacterium]|jgi:AraC-like DNA-binding protein|nr:AraC family transcriptional regulator [Chitinophagaceae bacterium]